MKIKGTLATSNKNIGELFIVAKNFYQKNLVELQRVETKKRKELAKKINEIKRKVYLREIKRAQSDTYNNFVKLIQAAKENYNRSVNQANLDCIEVIENICSEILEEEFNKNSDIITKKVRQEIIKLENKQFKIISNKSDLNYIKTEINCACLEDENIPKGVAVIRTESGSIEISWREHLKAIINKLKKENA